MTKPMNLLKRIKKIIFPAAVAPADDLNPALANSIAFRVGIIEFSDNVESDSGASLARLLSSRDNLKVFYFDEPFSKSFLSLESRTLFDLIDKGQDIIDKTGADVIIWGCREGEKIRLNFQISHQYENEEKSFVSLLDSLYIPARLFNDAAAFPPALLNLIYGAAISAITPENAEIRIFRRYLLKKIIHILSQDNSAKNLSIEYMPYIMNFLGIIYLSYAYDQEDGHNFRTIHNLLDTALKHQDLITNPIHLGCIYYHIAQLYDSATIYTTRNPSGYFKGAISYYRQAQKYLSKYNYPYDYGHISYKLAGLFFNYWKQKEDLQALRDAVFQLREAEKIYTYALFPEFWANIQGKLGQMLALLGSITKSAEISEIAITAYHNQQKVVTERRSPLLWANIQESLGEIHYQLGRSTGSDSHFEEALEYFHDALFVYENNQLGSEAKKISSSIAKTRQYLAA